MKTIISKYKCGHTHTTIFPRGCSKREEQALHNEIKDKLCSKCKIPDFEYCPQCGCATDRLVEGYCEDCHNERQSELRLHNARFDWWESLSDAERDHHIKQAVI